LRADHCNCVHTLSLASSSYGAKLLPLTEGEQRASLHDAEKVPSAPRVVQNLCRRRALRVSLNNDPRCFSLRISADWLPFGSAQGVGSPLRVRLR
jgi:hypothetical protein